MSRHAPRPIHFLCLAAAFALAAAPVHAQQRVELGVSLVNFTFISGDGDESVSLLGVPTVGFGIANPGVYGSFFVGRRFSIEPQVALTWIHSGGESFHLISTVAQANYFFRETSQDSAYVFGTVGGMFVEDEEDSPVTWGAGVGYRWRLGDRLVFRVDGRYIRTQNDFNKTNAVALTVWLGGLFGER